MSITKLRVSIRSLLLPLTALLVTNCAASVGEPLDTQDDALSSGCAPAVPPVLAVPDGNRLAFSYDAIGVQIYDCQTTAAGYGWVFRAPEAKLLDHRGRVAGTHYAGPTWQANDGSTVIGAKIAEYAADPTAIPWLLLRAADHGGDGRMSKVTFIHRLETSGGKAPASGCDANHVGAAARVDYASTYYFYAAR